MKARRLLALIAFLALTGLAAAFGAQFEPGAWHAALDKPPWHPPNGVFAPVWTVLYGLIAVAGWLAWSRRDRPGARAALVAWVLQLVLNAAWSWIFFGLHRIDLALVDIALLDLAVLAFILLARRVDRRASLAMLPYLAWILFATALNASILLRN